jgi:adenosylhomocysteinase
MIGLLSLRRKAEVDKPLEGAFIAGCTHVNAQTAVLIQTLVRLGAQVRWCACNIYSTHDHVAASLANDNIPIYAWSNETDEDFWWCISQVINADDDINWIPNMILDEGGDLTHYMQKSYPDIFEALKGIIEESESGLERLFQLSKNKLLDVPAINICDSFVKVFKRILKILITLF